VWRDGTEINARVEQRKIDIVSIDRLKSSSKSVPCCN